MQNKNSKVYIYCKCVANMVSSIKMTDLLLMYCRSLALFVVRKGFRENYIKNKNY